MYVPKSPIKVAGRFGVTRETDGYTYGVWRVAVRITESYLWIVQPEAYKTRAQAERAARVMAERYDRTALTGGLAGA